MACTAVYKLTYLTLPVLDILILLYSDKFIIIAIVHNNKFKLPGSYNENLAILIFSLIDRIS